MEQDCLLRHSHSANQIFGDLNEDVFEGLMKRWIRNDFQHSSLRVSGAATNLLSNKWVATVRGLTDRSPENSAHTKVPHVQSP